MLLQIIHTTGNKKEINSKLHDKEDYLEFIPNLQDKIKSAYKAGFEIVYHPNLMTETETECYFTPKDNYSKKFPLLSEKFPLLSKLKDIELTVLPDGVYARPHATELDIIISKINPSTILFGGAYMKWCVAGTANYTQSRYPDLDIKIATDISFDNKDNPIECYNSIPKTTLENYITKLPSKHQQPLSQKPSP